MLPSYIPPRRARVEIDAPLSDALDAELRSFPRFAGLVSVGGKTFALVLGEPQDVDVTELHTSVAAAVRAIAKRKHPPESTPAP